MENEREKELREELKKIQDSKPKGDSLLKLIRGLQRLQALGPPASSARSPSMERSEVAHLVGKYLGPSGSPSGTVIAQSPSSVLGPHGEEVRLIVQPNCIRCDKCLKTFESLMDLHFRQDASPCVGARASPVYILVRK